MRSRAERGSATVFLLGFAVVLLLCAGLAIDGGLALNLRARVADDAEQAARAGADSIDLLALRTQSGSGTSHIVIDETQAKQRVRQYLQSVGYHGHWSADVGLDSVHVTVHATSKTFFLGLFGVKFPVTASATAQPATGPGQVLGGGP